MTDDANAEADAEMTLAAFLTTVPPGRETRISDLFKADKQSSGFVKYYYATPAIQIHCPTPGSCEGERVFRRNYGTEAPKDGDATNVFLSYMCSNCGRHVKTFCLRVVREGLQGLATKVGEIPTFGPPLPAGLQRFIQDDRDLLLKGYRCEIQGQGIGAFAYYRRIVERQRNVIFDKLIQAARVLKDSGEIIADLEAAKGENQFLESMKRIKHGLPPALLIDGHNPLTTLHDALSDGLHNEDDQHCLSIAQTIRLVLTNLVQRMSEIVREDRELAQAIGALQRARQKKKGSAEASGGEPAPSTAAIEPGESENADGGERLLDERNSR